MHEEIEAATSPAAFSIISRRQLSAAFRSRRTVSEGDLREAAFKLSSIDLATVTPTSLPLPALSSRFNSRATLAQLVEQLIDNQRSFLYLKPNGFLVRLNFFCLGESPFSDGGSSSQPQAQSVAVRAFLRSILLMDRSLTGPAA
jgi:hypothetical protein